MSTTLASALRTIRQLYRELPTFNAEQIERLVDLELKGANRRSVLNRLVSRAAQLAADNKLIQLQSKIESKRNHEHGTSTRQQNPESIDPEQQPDSRRRQAGKRNRGSARKAQR
ncbi:hypothetical protein [Pseudomonas phage KPP25]|uniref:Uncharacterized protein n=1 Tax=Pseudomonas phage KPP25 TaxID=1462608 RepID=X5IGI0_BPKP2|nr:hypothetical protein FF13_gp71 [Pseudomonas phage KPP25]BAO58543.1 hypothetical protein [Pseudomonas phage KPP25]